MTGKNDKAYMTRAVQLARKGLSTTDPNPRVGCVLVKDTRVISVGYNGFLPKAPHKSVVINGHEKATVHAEQNSI